MKPKFIELRTYDGYVAFVNPKTIASIVGKKDECTTGISFLDGSYLKVDGDVYQVKDKLAKGKNYE